MHTHTCGYRLRIRTVNSWRRPRQFGCIQIFSPAVVVIEARGVSHESCYVQFRDRFGEEPFLFRSVNSKSENRRIQTSDHALGKTWSNSSFTVPTTMNPLNPNPKSPGSTSPRSVLDSPTTTAIGTVTNVVKTAPRGRHKRLSASCRVRVLEDRCVVHDSAYNSAASPGGIGSNVSLISMIRALYRAGD